MSDEAIETLLIMYEKTQHGSSQFSLSLICTSWLKALIVSRQQEVLYVWEESSQRNVDSLRN